MTGAPHWVFAVLGPLFLILGWWQWLKAGRVGPQARTWLMLGGFFVAVALLLWSSGRR